MSLKILQKCFPAVKSPVICNAPMLGAACPELAVEVTKAGGIGFNASIADISSGSAHLKKLDDDLTACRERLGSESPRLPVGASFITGHPTITSFTDTALPVIEKHRPAAVWLFAPDGEVKPHGTVISALQSLDVPPLVFVQVGNVTSAREAVRDGADVIVCQGADAGGHQFRQGMGVVSFVPSVKGMLRDEFVEKKDIIILAAGGIVNGDGVAAVLALGAQGVAMGTRFTVAEESIYPADKKQLVLDTADGGADTLKSPFNDQVVKNKLWGPLYDGRAIIGPVHDKFLAGASLEECQNSLEQDYTAEEAPRIIGTWAGTGVGMVKKAQPAGEIVREVHKEAVEIIKGLAGVL